jgi:predicted DNA-binding transcriptional regulator AlpA
MAHPDRKSSILPAGMPLLLCSRIQAAQLLNISPSTFDKLRKANALLRPVQIGSRPLWPLKNLMAYVDELIDGDTGPDDPWVVAS